MNRHLFWLAAFAAMPAFSATPVGIDSVATTSLAPLDHVQLRQEDLQRDVAGLPPRYAVPQKVMVDAAHGGGTWSDLGDGTRLWRYRVTATGAYSLNFGFGKFRLPEGAELSMYSVDGREKRGPFTAADNDAHGQFWTPVLLADDVVIQLRIPAAVQDQLVLTLTQIGQGYRGFGEKRAQATANALSGASKSLQPEGTCEVIEPVEAANTAKKGWAIGEAGIKSAEKSGSCNMDVNCLTAGDPWRETARASATISTGGSTFCSGSLVNNTANDKKMLFVTAAHCGINAGNAASLVTYWNFESPTCRVPGSGASGGAGGGSLAQFNTGSNFIITNSPSDFTLVELDDPANPAFNLYWAGWDRSSADAQCSPSSMCAGIHHPNTDEKRITFVDVPMTTTSYNNPAIPGNSTHVHAYWDATPVFPPNPSQTIPPQVTEGGSSGSPLYTAQRRFIGQLHGGPSSCGSTGENLSDYYGKFSLSAVVPAAQAQLAPGGGTMPMTIDGRAECTAPNSPGIGTATATAPNQVQVTWNAVAGTEHFKVFRALGTCAAPGTFAMIADNQAGTTYLDGTVSGGSTYAYRVSGVDEDQPCESQQSTCVQATATGQCTLAPTFAGATSATSAGTASCAVNVGWNAGSANCGAGSSVTYSVFRSTTPNFTPSAGNRIAQCLTGATLADTTANYQTPYYYEVHAEDNATSGGGACNGGNVDANAIELRGVAAGAPAVTFTDGAESGPSAWTVSGSGAGSNFSIVTTAAHGGTSSWFVVDADAVSDRQLTKVAPVTPQAGSTLEFWHRYDTEATYDGGVLEYSLDGTTWFDILSGNGGAIPANGTRFLAGGYTGAMQTGSNPLSGRPAWHGTIAAFAQVRVDLSDFAGQTVRFRFRFGADVNTTETGWWIDDVVFADPTSCSVGPSDVLFAHGFEG